MSEKSPYSAVYEAVLAAALPMIAENGWQNATLEAACAAAEIDDNIRILAFPHGVESLIIAFFEAQDTALLAALGAGDTPPKIRERIMHGVKMRLQVDSPYRAVLSAALGWLVQPQHHILASRLLFKTAHIIWRWAGDTATDYNYYSKRLILSGVLAATTTYWLRDDSEDYTDTDEFLRRRINNVMAFEKLKASVKSKFKPTETAA